MVIDTESLEARGLAGKRTLIKPTGQDVCVDMEDSLASSLTGVEHQAEFAIRVLAGELLSHGHQLRKKLGVAGGKLGDVCVFLRFWHHKKVHGCLGGNIPKGNEVIVFHQDVRRDFPGHNLGKD
jgi:hypothetical protein